MTGRYILMDTIPVEEPDLLKWAAWVEDIANRRVAWDEVGKFSVSTIFLGIDHNFDTEGDPILFETMVFLSDKIERATKDAFDEFCQRYRTWPEAVAGHAAAIQWAKDHETDDPPQR